MEKNNNIVFIGFENLQGTQNIITSIAENKLKDLQRFSLDANEVDDLIHIRVGLINRVGEGNDIFAIPVSSSKDIILNELANSLLNFHYYNNNEFGINREEVVKVLHKHV